MAASNDTAALLVALEAKLDKFEKAMDQAYGSADRAVRKIENRFSQANLTFGKLFGATAAGGFISQALSDPLQLAINKARELGDEFSKTAGLAKFLQTSIGRVQEVQFAFELGGGSFDTFRTSSEQFLRNAEEAKRALDQVGTLSSRNINKIENDFARLFRANKDLGVSLTDSTGNLKSWDDLLADASTLISNAKTELEKVQIAEMLGLSREWVKVLEEGPEKFKKIAASAREAGAVLDDSLIKSAKEFDRAWDRSMTLFKARFKETIAEFPDAWSRVVESLKAGLNLLPRLMINPGELGFGTNGSQETAGAAVSDAGNKATSSASTPGARASGSASGSAGKSTVIPFKLRSKDNELDQEIKQLEKRRQVLDAETATLYENTAAREKARAAAELLAAAENAGLTVTDAMRQRIDEVAAAYGRSAEQAEIAKAKLSALNDASREFGSALSTAFQEAALQGKKLSDVVSDLANRLTGRAIDKIFDLFFAPQPGQATSAFGGILQSILPGVFGGARAEGGDVSSGKVYKVGERGTELFAPSRSGTIIPNHELGGGGSNITVQVHNNAGADVSVGAPRRGSDGMTIEVMIDRATARSIATPGSETSKLLRGGFGLAPALTRR